MSKTKYWMDERGLVVTDKWLQSDAAASDYRAIYTTPVKKLGDGCYALDCEYCGGNDDDTPPEHTQDCARPIPPKETPMNLPPYRYGRECGENEKVWDEESVRQAQREAVAASEHSMAMMYLSLTDAMGYESGPTGIENSPEEWATALLKDAAAYREGKSEAVAAAVPEAVPEVRFGNMADPFTHIIQHLNSNPYSLTKDECVSLVKELRDKYLEAAPEVKP